MKVLKAAALGLLLASAAWIPGFANGLDEAKQVTSDPFTAYTLYEDLPIADAIRTFDALPDWVKKMEYIKQPYYDGPTPLTYTYTRTLEDKTKQVLTFQKYEGQTVLGAFTLIFYTKNAKDAQAMYEQAYRSIDLYQKWIKTGGLDKNYTNFWDKYGYTVYIEVNTDKKRFTIQRHSIIPD